MSSASSCFSRPFSCPPRLLPNPLRRARDNSLPDGLLHNLLPPWEQPQVRPWEQLHLRPSHKRRRHRRFPQSKRLKPLTVPRFSQQTCFRACLSLPRQACFQARRNPSQLHNPQKRPEWKRESLEMICLNSGRSWSCSNSPSAKARTGSSLSPPSSASLLYEASKDASRRVRPASFP